MSDVIDFRIYVYGPDEGPIDNSFESAEQLLVDSVGVYFEPDGSFAWSGSVTGEQVFGMLYDAAGRLQYVELQGNVTRQSLRRILHSIVGTPGVPAPDVLAATDVPSNLSGLTLKSLIGTPAGPTGGNDLQSFEELAFG